MSTKIDLIEEGTAAYHFVQLPLSDSLTALQNLWSLEAAAAAAAFLDADGAAVLFLLFLHFWSFVFVVHHQQQHQLLVVPVSCRPLSCQCCPNTLFSAVAMAISSLHLPSACSLCCCCCLLAVCLSNWSSWCWCWWCCCRWIMAALHCIDQTRFAARLLANERNLWPLHFVAFFLSFFWIFTVNRVQSWENCFSIWGKELNWI